MTQTTMLSMALSSLYSETGSKFDAQDNWWANVFQSYCHTPGNEGISNAYVSKYRRGKRVIASKYTRHYSTSASLRIPPALVKDVREHLNTYATQAQLVRIYNGMIRYCQAQNTYDRTKLMPATSEKNPDLSSIATLCAAVIWHAMCYDLSHAALAEKEGYDE